MAGIYSQAHRSFACAGCGAPLEVDLDEGGSVCASCGRDNRREARREVEKRVHELEGRLLSPWRLRFPIRLKTPVALIGCMATVMLPPIWCVVFVGTGEMGAGAPPDAWKPGLLVSVPGWVSIVTLLVASLGGPLLFGLTLALERRRERAEMRDALARARQELAAYDARQSA